MATGPLLPDDAAPADVPIPRYSLTLNTSAVFIAAIAVQFIGFIGSLFVYKYVGINAAGQALFGTVQFFLLIASTINTIGDLRLGAGYTLLIARGRSALQNTGTYLLLRFAMVAGIGVVVLASSGVSVGGQQLVSTSQQFEVLAIFMVLPVLWSFATVFSSYFVGIGNAAKGQWPSIVEVCVRTPVVIVVALFWPTLLGLTLAYLVGAAGSAIYAASAVAPLLRKYVHWEALTLFRYSWPLLGSLVLATVASTTIPFVVQWSLGVTELNWFNGANAFRILALALPNAIVAPLLPYIAALHKRGEYNRVRESTWQALRYSSMLLIPGVIALVVYRVNVLYILYNASYVGPAAVPLAILVFAAIPGSFAAVIGTGLEAIGWRRLELYLTVVQTVTIFGIAFALMPPYGLLPRSDGLISASVAVLASSFVAFALNAYFMYRLMAVHIFPWSIGYITVSAALSFVSIASLNAILPINRYYQLALGVLLGFAVYFVVLALLGELTKQDVHRIGESFGLSRRLRDPFARLCWRETTPHLLPEVDLENVAGLTTGYTSAGRSLPPRKPLRPPSNGA